MHKGGFADGTFLPAPSEKTGSVFGFANAAFSIKGTPWDTLHGVRKSMNQSLKWLCFAVGLVLATAGWGQSEEKDVKLVFLGSATTNGIPLILEARLM